MDKSEFQTRAVSVFHSLKYFFDEDFEQGQAVPRPSTAYKALVKGASILGGGIIGALSTGSAKFTDAEVASAVRTLRNHCDFAALLLDPETAALVLFVYADDLTDETLIGKTHLIRGEIKQFRQFTMKMGFAKGTVYADIFFVFLNSDKAFHFRQSVQERCKQTEFWAQIYVLPWVINLSAKSVWPYSGLPFVTMRPLKPADIEAKLFA